MRPTSARFRTALGGPHRRATSITCTVPGGEPVELAFAAGSVSSSNSTGVRYQASLTLAPKPGFDTFTLVSTPGAIFRIQHGIDFGAGDSELIDCGVYEAAKGAMSLAGGDIRLSLVDMWQRVDRCKFLMPHYPTMGPRSLKIAEALADVTLPAPTIIQGVGGMYEQDDRLWDIDRTTFINDMAKDGSLDAAFDASGAFRIRPEPILDPKASVWTFRTGESGNINSADRERPFDRLYNMVIVEPDDATQSWDRVIVVLPEGHPRHPDKIGGAAPFYTKSPTSDTSDQAEAVGQTIMQRVLGDAETVNFDALSNPALEVGDVINLAHERTDTDPGLMASHIIDSFQMDLRTGSMSAATRSTSLTDLGAA